MKIIKVKSPCFIKWKSRMKKSVKYKTGLIFLEEMKRILTGKSKMYDYEQNRIKDVYDTMLEYLYFNIIKKG